ncbi:hypothetical protein IscW_ISCW010755 [Ixodes scapularis]|uniref:Uncharacterized protein n=1 Tax=Ixodes scapularis TaxID=6945 RepID=B7Q8I5_IXOSC|nr:hypothetical protein IscW_ISCW010755 [Ixodes scapularis]|eukprot:XP_002405147.1 hypothetical protein IscW_ISCW010755 [Ixodes scapularis]
MSACENTRKQEVYRRAGHDAKHALKPVLVGLAESSGGVKEKRKVPTGIFRAPMPPNSWVNPVVAPGCWSELVVDGPLSG